MRMKRVVCLIVAICMAGLVLAQGSVGDSSISSSSKTININFEDKGIKLIVDDPNINAYIKGNKIIFEPMTPEQIERISNKLSLIDRIRLKTLGLAVSFNLKWTGHIDPTQRHEFEIDLTKPGTYKIGFGTDVFEVTGLSVGIYNLTEELGGNVRVEGSELLGHYWSEVIDLNTTSSIHNITVASSQPAGTDISIAVRTHNMTNGNYTGIYEGLIGFWKLEGGTNVKDFTGNNLSGTADDGNNFNATGAYGQSYAADGSSDNIAISDSRTMDDFTVSLWMFDSNPNGGDAECIIGSGGRHCAAGGSSTKGWGIGFDSRNNLRFDYGTGTSGRGARAGAQISDTNWHHIIAMRSGTTAYIYVDNDLKKTQTGMPSGDVWLSQILIGHIDLSGYQYSGGIDEVAIWNRTLSAGERTQVYNGELLPFSSYSDEYTAAEAGVDVEDGRMVQFRATMTRTTGTEVLELQNVSIAYGAIGAAPDVDNPPTVSLTTVNDSSFGTQNVSLNFTASDDSQLVNATLYGTWAGGWHANQTISLSGTSVTNEPFNLNLSVDGTYEWNVVVGDNATTTQYATNFENHTITVSTTCVDSTCFPYVCNPSTNACYTTCTSHSHVNASSYCASDGTAKVQIEDTLTCQNVEYSGLADNDACVGNYCFDDTIGTTGEYCTDVSDGCVNDGTEYNQGGIVCGFGDGNDYYQCLGGESSWDTLSQCLDIGDPHDASATYTEGGHTYCGYYDVAQTCSVTLGCTAGSTDECGSYFFNETASVCGDQVSGVTDDIKKAACDVGCGATYDLETCPEPNNLSIDCTTCTAPAVDNPPEVTLISPTNGSTQTTASITFQYNVTDENPLENCSLYLESNTTSWSLNQTNTSVISRVAANSFSAVEFDDGYTVTWNVLCTDSLNNVSFAEDNSTFDIGIEFVEPEGRMFEIFENTTTREDSNPLFTVNKSGTVNISEDLYVYGDYYLHGTTYGLSPFVVDKLLIKDYIEFNVTGRTGYRMNNPYNEYVKLEGKDSGGNILFALFQDNPIISTESGSKIEFLDDVYIGGNLSVLETINGTDIELSGNITAEGKINSSQLCIDDDCKTYWNENGIWETNGTIIYNSTADRVGIGTAAPTASLEVAGTIPFKWGAAGDQYGFLTWTSAAPAKANIYASANKGLSLGAGLKQDLIYLASGGNVSIGTKYPGSFFTVAGDLNVSGSNNNHVLFVDESSGRVGIGVGSPGSKLHIQSAADSVQPLRITDSDNSNNIIFTVGVASSHGLLQIRDSSENVDIQMSTGGNSYFNGGNVGIGTTTPGSLLTIAGDLNVSGSNNDHVLWVDESAGRVGVGVANPGHKFQIEEGNMKIRNNDADSFVSFFDSGQQEWRIGLDKSNSEAFSFADSSNLSTNVRMVIEKAGDVGIGTQSPDRTLHVHAGSAGSVTGSAYSPTMVVENEGNYNGISLLIPDAGSNIIDFGSPSDNRYASISTGYNNGNPYLIISTGDATLNEVVRVYESSGVWAFSLNDPSGVSRDVDFYHYDSSGDKLIHSDGALSKIGIGTGNPAAKLHINSTYDTNGNLYIQSTNSDSAAIGLGTKTSPNANSRRWRIASNANVVGNLDFFVGSNSTESPTVAVVSINRSGGVGIGTTAPTHDLNVVGNINVTTLGAATATDLCINAGLLSSCSSSKEFKENINNLTVSDDLWNKYNQLTPVTFNFINSSKVRVGLIAEDVEKIFPKLVYNVSNPIYEETTTEEFDEELNATVKKTTKTVTGEEVYPTVDYDDVAAANILFIQDLYDRTEEICNKDSSYSWC